MLLTRRFSLSSIHQRQNCCAHTGSCCVPFPSVLKDGKQLKSPEELSQVFSSAGINVNEPVVASCGSGLTASILALAIHQVNGGKVVSAGKDILSSHK